MKAEIIKEIIDIENYKETKGSYRFMAGYSMAGYKVITNKQEILLLIDNEGNCCEKWGWFWSNDKPEEFIGAELKNIEVTDTDLNPVKSKNEIGEYGTEAGGIMYINLKTNKGPLQFTAYNCHNGYYGHKAKLISNQLNHSEYL